MKRLASGILSILFIVQCLAPSAAGHQDEVQITPAEDRAAKEIAARFTKSLQQTGDLGPILSDLYAVDFIERYVRQQEKIVVKDHTRSPHMYFAPGLEYKSGLLREATADDWRRFYIATNNFLYDGAQRGMKKFAKDILGGRELTEINKTDLYPARVVSLLDAHPILKNVILKNAQRTQGKPSKDGATPIGTPEEMRNAAATLEQAVALTRDERSKGRPAKEFKQLVELMEQAGILKPSVDVTEEEFFGYPPGTRIVHVLTPVMFRLTLIGGGGKYRILWAEPSTGD